MTNSSARRKYLKQAHKTESPSVAARTPKAIRRAQADCPLYNGRPIGLTGPPISIYEPIFATIDDKLRDLKSVNGDPLIEAVTKLVSDVNKVYDDESSYQAGTVKSLGAALGISLTEFVSTASGTERTTESDALWKCKLADDLSEAIVVHVEWKLELGIGGEGQLQNALCLRKQLTERQYKGVVNSSCCPSILITMAGPYISFAGFLFAEVWISQAFTPCLPLILKPGMEQEQIQELSKYFTVFKEAIGNLKDKYSRVMVQNDMTLSMLLPRPEYLPNKAPPEDLQFIERFQFEGLHSDDHMCYLFKAQYGDKPALVKFGGRYGEDAHRLLANEGLAPELYFCTTIAGGLTMVVMEDLSEAQQMGRVFWRAQIPQRVFDDVKRAVQILHANKLVFGDLRQPNILVTQLADGVWRTQLVDFTWAGTEGVVRYPHYELNPEIKWHPEVQVGCLIKREHDLHMLELLQKS